MSRSPMLADWIDHIKKCHPPKAGTLLMPDEGCEICIEYDVLNQLDFDLGETP